MQKMYTAGLWGKSEIFLKPCQAWAETAGEQTSLGVSTNITIQNGIPVLVPQPSLPRLGPEFPVQRRPWKRWIRFFFSTAVQSVSPPPWAVCLSQLPNNTSLYYRDGLLHLHAASLESRTEAILGWSLLPVPPFNMDQTQLRDTSLLSFIHGDKHILSLRLTFCLSPQTQIIYFFFLFVVVYSIKATPCSQCRSQYCRLHFFVLTFVDSVVLPRPSLLQKCDQLGLNL